jgi:DNA mismatch repair protein MutS2
LKGARFGIAVIDHYPPARRTPDRDNALRRAQVVCVDDEGVVSAAFGFNPETFAPTYRLMYGSPGRSLAIEIAARLGMPKSVIAAARENLTEPEKQLAEHLARVDDDLRESNRNGGRSARSGCASPNPSENCGRAKHRSPSARSVVRRRLDAKLDDQLRDARAAIDAVVEI